MSAFDFLWHLVSTQRHRHPADDEHAARRRFADRLVVIGPKFRWALPDERLVAGEDLWFYRMPAPEREAPYRCEIIYEDDLIMVVDKPPFLATMPRGMHITQTVTVQMRKASANDELTPAHRLDRNTAGVLLLTKKRAVRGAYQQLFSARSVQKTYEAIGSQSDSQPGDIWRYHLLKKAGEVQGSIGQGPPNSETLVHDIRGVNAQEQTQLETMHGPLPPQAVYALKPHTGKTHQLRLHMLAAGHPILGDPAYPNVLPLGQEKFDQPMHLLASRLCFEDPVTGEWRDFASRRSVVRMEV
ncbi:Ribosomal large subunit pseudouridine synthase A [Corynebacterium gerontici]|uniref:RNA pseudouridylate synthase n=1 Tax=Corynebacterium gerontici TaxID=2079234 RepID=A0A3G6J261_9CORY|nr:Ribosomal large subunit pseudouridine synthase A [Corynebacterium gerontici]